jgi:hypothetical protein
LSDRTYVLADTDERGIVILAAGELEQFHRIAQLSADTPQCADCVLEQLTLLAEFLRALAIVPDGRIFDQCCDFD